MNKHSILNRYILNKIKKNRVQNFLLIFTIALTTGLLTVIFILAIQSSKVLINEQARQVGTISQGMVENSSWKDYLAIKKNTALKNVNYNILVGFWENSSFKERGIEIRYANAKVAEKMFSYPEVGRMPKNSGELVVDTYVLKMLNLPLKLDQTVEMKFSFLNQQYIRKFRVVGYYNQNRSSIASEVIISKSDMQYLYQNLSSKKLLEESKQHYYGSGLINVQFDVKESNKLSENYCRELLEKCGVKTDNTLSYMNPAYEKQPMSVSSIAFLIISCVTVMITAYLTIYNVFQISVYKEISKYGILNMIGAGKRQISKIMRTQVIILSLFGIPLGHILGYALGMFFLPKFMLMSLGAYANDVSKVPISPMIFLFSTVLVFITVLLSCRKPTKTASSISPIEAACFDASHSNKQRRNAHAKKPTIAFVSYQNVFQDKRKAIVTIFSLSMSCILVMSVFTFTKSFSIDKYIQRYSLGDVHVANYNWFHESQNKSDDVKDLKVSNEYLSKIRKLHGVKDVYKLYYGNSLNKATPKMISKIKEYKAKGILDTGEFNISDVLDGKEGLQECRYLVSSGLLSKLKVVRGKIDKKKFLSGNYVIEGRIKTANSDITLCDVNDKISLSYPDKKSTYVKVGQYGFYKNNISKQYEVMAVVEIPMYMMPYGEGDGQMLSILPLTTMSTVGMDTSLSGVIINTESKSNEDVEEWISTYTSDSGSKLDYVSKTSIAKTYRNLVDMIQWIGGGLSIIIAIIGLVNYINAFITGVLSRRKEIGMLKSVGMTDNQLKEMLILENMYSVAFIGIIGVFFGSLLSFFGVALLSKVINVFEFQLSIVPVVLEILMFLILGIVLSLIGYQLNNGSVVESIREE